MSLPQQKLDEISEKLEQGWILLQNPCPLCHSPLIKHLDQGTYCAKCGAFLVTESEAKQMNLNMNSAEEPEKATEARDSMERELEEDNMDAWDDEYYNRRLEHVDRASSAIGSRLLQGWTLLADSCPSCGTPLMSFQGGPQECVMCSQEAPPETKTEPETKREPEISNVKQAEPMQSQKSQVSSQAPPVKQDEPEMQMSSFDAILKEKEAEQSFRMSAQSAPVVLSSRAQPAPVQRTLTINTGIGGSLRATLTQKLTLLNQALTTSQDVAEITVLAQAIKEVSQALTASSSAVGLQLPTVALNSSAPVVQPGQQVPDVSVWKVQTGLDGKTSSVEFNLREYCREPTVMFAVVGAFTPTCHKTHLPEYVEMSAEFRKVGIKNIACVSVNDPFVMQSWGDSVGAGNAVDMISDDGQLAKALGLYKERGGALGGRFIRSAFVIVDNVFHQIRVDEKGLSQTSAKEMLQLLNHQI